jgi:hypothetical protein
VAAICLSFRSTLERYREPLAALERLLEGSGGSSDPGRL